MESKKRKMDEMEEMYKKYCERKEKEKKEKEDLDIEWKNLKSGLGNGVLLDLLGKTNILCSKIINAPGFDDYEKSKIISDLNEIKCFGEDRSLIINGSPKKGSKWLDNCSLYNLKSLETLVEKMDCWISPDRRGSVGMYGHIFVEVSDLEMNPFLEAIGESKDWKSSYNQMELHSFPYSKSLLGRKWCSSNEEVVRNFLGRFIKFDCSKLLERHYLCDSTQDIEIKIKDVNAINNTDVREACRLLNWNYNENNDIHIKSCKVILGKYTRPGSITSKCIQNENQTNKKKNGVGKFTIQYIENVYPISKKGILRFNCKYFLYKNGIKSDN